MDQTNPTGQTPVVSATEAAVTTPPKGDAGLMDSANEVKNLRPQQSAVNAQLGSPSVTINNSVSSTGGAPSSMDSSLQLGDSKDYWWNTLANDKAYSQYQSDVNNAVMNSLAARTNIEKNAATAMENFFNEQYASAAQVDKAGWTGGYVLDADRQMSYLKATIAADMYSQMELQKQGYDSQLAAARYAYESNEKTLAFEYYQAAVNNSIQEAQVTGYYMPPEAKENLAQLRIAEKMLADANASPVDKKKAQGVVSAANAWFTAQGISKQGVKTLAMLQHEETVRANKENERLQQLEIDSANMRHAAEMALGYAQLAEQKRMNDQTIKGLNDKTPNVENGGTGTTTEQWDYNKDFDYDGDGYLSVPEKERAQREAYAASQAKKKKASDSKKATTFNNIPSNVSSITRTSYRAPAAVKTVISGPSSVVGTSMTSTANNNKK